MGDVIDLAERRKQKGGIQQPIPFPAQNHYNPSQRMVAYLNSLDQLGRAIIKELSDQGAPAGVIINALNVVGVCEAVSDSYEAWVGQAVEEDGEEDPFR